MIYYFEKTQIIISIIIYFIMLIFSYRIIDKSDRCRLIYITLLYCYFIGVVYYTIFPIYNDEAMREAMGSISFSNNVNIVPFKDILNTSAVLNIIMTIPFGFLLPFVLKISAKKTIVIGIMFSLLIETAQLLIGLYFDFTVRLIDVNDVICNSLGVILGYMMFFVVIKITRCILNTEEHLNVFLQYIVDRKTEF